MTFNVWTGEVCLTILPMNVYFVFLHYTSQGFWAFGGFIGLFWDQGKVRKQF